MAALILPSRRVVQPPEGVDVDWSNPINRSLGGLFDTRSGLELVYNNRASNFTSLKAASRAGIAADFSSTANQQYAHRPGYATTGAMTIFALMEVRALSNFGAVIAKQQTTTVNVPFEFRLAGSSATGSDFNFVRASASSGANSKQTAESRLSAAPGVPRAIAITVADGLLATIPNAYVDKVKTPFKSNSTAGSCTDSAQSVWIGRRYDGAVQLDGRIYFVGLWNRELSDAEINALTDNPWQLFRPIQRRIWVPVAGGGGATLQPGLLTNTNTLYAPTVTTGAVSVTPPLLSSAALLYAPTVTPGAVTLQPGLLDASAALFAPSVSVGALTASPPLLSAEAVLYAPTVAVAGAALQPGLLSAEAAPFAPSVSVGAVTLQPGLLSAEAVLYAPEVTAFAPGAQAVQPPLLSALAAVFAPSITVGAVSLAPPLLSAEAAPYAPTVTTGVTVSAPLLSADAVLYAPAVTAGVAEVLPPLLASEAILYAPSVSFGQVLSAPLLSSPAVPYAPTLFEGALSYDKAYLVAPPARLWRADGSPRNWRTS